MTAPSLAKQSRIVAWSPIYYGWIVWAVATVGWIASSPGQSFTVSLFFDFFIEDFGLSRTAVSSLYGAGTFAASLALTWVGLQIDRFGNRKMGVVIAAFFAIAVVLLSLVDRADNATAGFCRNSWFGAGRIVVSQYHRDCRVVSATARTHDECVDPLICVVSSTIHPLAPTSTGNLSLAAYVDCAGYRGRHYRHSTDMGSDAK